MIALATIDTKRTAGGDVVIIIIVTIDAHVDRATHVIARDAPRAISFRYIGMTNLPMLMRVRASALGFVDAHSVAMALMKAMRGIRCRRRRRI